MNRIKLAKVKRIATQPHSDVSKWHRYRKGDIALRDLNNEWDIALTKGAM